MSWEYHQESGEILHDGVHVGYGYAGHDEGKNNPEMERVKNVGPLPRGTWTIGAPTDTKTHGPFVMTLYPRDETETFGRSGFLIHGDSIKTPGTASHGCIICARWVRDKIWQSGDRVLLVKRGPDSAPDVDGEIGV